MNRTSHKDSHKQKLSSFIAKKSSNIKMRKNFLLHHVLNERQALAGEANEGKEKREEKFCAPINYR